MEIAIDVGMLVMLSVVATLSEEKRAWRYVLVRPPLRRGRRITIITSNRL